jgi:hypothetical protein
MRQLRSLVAALTPMLFFLVTAQVALAQTPSVTPSGDAGNGAGAATEVAKGFCAPWHRCLAMGTLGLALLTILAMLLGYLIQRRGFEKVEHRQGNPEGVRVD